MRCALKSLSFVLGFVLLTVAVQAGPLTTITLDNSNGQSLAVDPARHFLYTGEGVGTGTKHLDVISTLTNTVVGNYSFSGSGSTSDIAASGTQVFWADQGDSTVRVISVSDAGVPTLSRSDSFTLPTGIGALATTYGESSQGGGDSLRIVRVSDGVVLHTTSLGGTASTVHSDTLSNLYYVQNPSNALVIDSTGAILRTVTGLVATIDSSSTHHFVYVGTNNQVLQQLNGSDDSSTGKSFDFGSGASVTSATVDSLTGNVWVSISAQNVVDELSPNMTLIQQFTVPNPAAIAFDNNVAYVQEGGTALIAVVPEPASMGLLSVLIGAMQLRRRTRRGPASRK